MPRIFDDQADISNRQIKLRLRTKGEVEENEAIIFYDESDNRVKIETEDEILSLLPSIPSTIFLNNTSTLDQNDSNKLILLNNQNGFTVTLPPIANVNAGTRYKFMVVTLLLVGNEYDIDSDIIDVNIMQGIISGPENVAYPFAAGADTVSFIGNGVARIGDFVEIISDSQCWLISGMSRVAAGITFA